MIRLNDVRFILYLGDFLIVMKVKELIEKLQEFDGELEVKSDNRYRQDIMSVTMCKIQYKSLDEKYVYIG